MTRSALSSSGCCVAHGGVFWWTEFWLTSSCFVSRTVDFDSFLKVLNRPGGFREPGEPEEYCRGFQVFDKDMTGFIGVGQLRYSMFSLCSVLCALRIVDCRWMGC
jgi:hypothetical protein